MGGRVIARVLLVEDLDELRFAVGAFLRKVGNHVESAASAEEALELAGRATFDVALVDAHLREATDDADGLALASALRALARAPRVVIMSGALTLEVEEMAEELGASRVLEKPVALSEIAALVAELAAVERWTAEP